MPTPSHPSLRSLWPTTSGSIRYQYTSVQGFIEGRDMQGAKASDQMNYLNSDISVQTSLYSASPFSYLLIHYLLGNF